MDDLETRYTQYLLNGMKIASDADIAAAEKPAEPARFSPMFGAATERPKTGVVEAAGTVGTAIAASVPAGLAGIYEFIKTQNPESAGQRIDEIQKALTAIPQTEDGMKALESVGKFMQALGVTGEIAGDAFFNIAQKAGAGQEASAVAGTIGNIFADPLNLVTLGTLSAGIKGVRTAAGKTLKSMVLKSEASPSDVTIAPTVPTKKPDIVGEYMYEKSAAKREGSYTGGYESGKRSKKTTKNAGQQ